MATISWMTARRSLLGLGLALITASCSTVGAQTPDEHAEHHPPAAIEAIGSTTAAAPMTSQPASQPASQPTSQPAGIAASGMDCCCGNMMGGGGMMMGDKSSGGMMGGGMKLGDKSGRGMMMSGQPGGAGQPAMKSGMGMMGRDPQPLGRMRAPQPLSPGQPGVPDRDGMRRRGMLGRSPLMMDSGADRSGLALPRTHHLGAREFFLDRRAGLSLKPEQETQLRQIRERALLDLATHARAREQAEQDLWVLTGERTPDPAKVEAKIREIANHEVEARLAYFKAVREAVAVLTPEQQTQLLGAEEDAASPVP